VDLITTNVDTEDEEKVYEKMLHRVEVRMNERVLIGTFGAMRTNNEATQWYYLVEWIIGQYIVQENMVMKGVELQQSAFVGKIIRDAVFWNPASNAIDWYTPMSKREGLVMIRLKQVLLTGVTMMEINENNMLLSKYNKI